MASFYEHMTINEAQDRISQLKANFKELFGHDLDQSIIIESLDEALKAKAKEYVTENLTDYPPLTLIKFKDVVLNPIPVLQDPIGEFVTPIIQATEVKDSEPSVAPRRRGRPPRQK